MSKSMFLVQYYPYQYEQFKLLIDELGSDVFYKSDLSATGNRRLPKEYVYDLNGNVITLDEIEKRNYDYLLYTGPRRSYIESLAKLTKYHYTIYLSHSLMGTIYDISISLAPYQRSIGIMPELWESFYAYNRATEHALSVGRSFRYIKSKSNPIVAQCLSYTPKVDVIPNSLGLVLGEKSPFDSSIKEILSNKDRLGIDKVFVKFHPLTEKEDMNKFTDPIFTILDTNTTHKYDFTDRCEYIVGGASSLLIESIMRNKFYNRNQKFMKLNIKRGVDIDLPKLSTYDTSVDNKFLLYDSMIDSPQSIIDEHLNIIKYIESNLI